MHKKAKTPSQWKAIAISLKAVMAIAIFTLLPNGQIHAEGPYFEFEIETSFDGQTFEFQIDDGANLQIDWDDGSGFQSAEDGSKLHSHTYENQGTYEIKVKGEASRISFYEGTQLLVRDILTPVSPGVTGITSAKNMFRSVSIAEFTAENFFDSASENVTDMSYMFYDASEFNGNIGGWDTSSVEDMSNMFEGAISFNQDLNWNTSNVRNMERMFREAEIFNGDISGWDTSNLENMNEMFYSAESFNGDIGGWNTSSVTDMSLAFSNAESFNQDIGGWDTSSVTTMKKMFEDIPDFNHDLTDWNTSNVEDMSRMFSYAESFNGDIGDWDTSNVKDMSYMLSGAGNFNQDIGGWDTANAEDMSGLFNRATSFNQDIGGWDISSANHLGSMFSNAESFNQDISNWDTSNATNMANMFSGATDFNGNIGNWNTSNVESMGGMFKAASSFNIDIGEWDTKNVTDMASMFSEATSFNQDLTGWCVEQIPEEPTNFATFGSALENENKPLWGAVCWVPASNVSFTNVGTSQMTVHWESGNGDGRVVFVKEGNEGTASPATNKTYETSAQFGNGEQIGSTGWYAVYEGGGSTITVTGLSSSTTYRVHVIEFKEKEGVREYCPDMGENNPANRTTSAPSGGGGGGGGGSGPSNGDDNGEDNGEDEDGENGEDDENDEPDEGSGPGIPGDNGMGGPGEEEKFTDIEGHWGERYIMIMAIKCDVQGYSDEDGNLLNLFGPNNSITRAELTKMVGGCFVNNIPEEHLVERRPFPDVALGRWHTPYISYAKARGWVHGYPDGFFRPSNNINRVEALKVVLLSQYTEDEIRENNNTKTADFKDTDPGSWYSHYMDFAVSKEIVGGYYTKDGHPTGYFGPANDLTRAEAAKIIVETLGL